MLEIPLMALPNQTFSIRLDGSFYDLHLFETAGVMACSITRDNVVIVQGLRVVAGTPLIPFSYLENGNFIFLTEDDELPDYRNFENNQTLIFASQAELDAIANG